MMRIIMKGKAMNRKDCHNRCRYGCSILMLLMLCHYLNGKMAYGFSSCTITSSGPKLLMHHRHHTFSNRPNVMYLKRVGVNGECQLHSNVRPHHSLLYCIKNTGKLNPIDDDETRIEEQFSPSSSCWESKDSSSTTFKYYLKLLFKMMRPGNFPGVLLFHFVGVHNSLSVLCQNQDGLHYTISLFLQTVLQPSIMATLFSLLLIVSSSMIVNDYYDARLGADTFQTLTSPLHLESLNEKALSRPLESGLVSLHIAKWVLNNLYFWLLMTSTVLPGVPTRLLVMGGCILTFYYTKYIKPRTWFKNISCAILMSLAPLTSGSATLFHPSLEKLTITTMSYGYRIYMIWQGLGALFCSLFCGFMGREIIMDITDYDSDKNTGINTIPVVHGKVKAAKIVLLFWLASSFFICAGPVLAICFSFQSCNVLPPLVFFKLFLALGGSTWITVRAIQLVASKASDERLLDKSIEEAKVSVLFFLASSMIPC